MNLRLDLRQMADDERGLATLQSIMILAVSAAVLLTMQSLTSSRENESVGLFATLERKFDHLFNGSPDGSLDLGDGSGGDGSGGDGSGGDGSDGGNGSDGDGSDGDGSDGDGSGGNGSGGNGSGGNGSGGDDDDQEDEDSASTLDPFPLNFPETVAKAIAEKTKQQLLDQIRAQVAATNQSFAVRQQLQRIALEQHRAGLRNPNLSILDRAALQNRLSAANIAAKDAQIAAQQAAQNFRHVAEQTTRFSRAVGTLGAVDGLLAADRHRQQLIAEGKYQEAYRVSVGGAARYIASVATTFTDRLPGVTGTIASETIAAGAELAGRQIADDTFPAMVDLSHWLYERSWWPRNRPPRFPRGYDPARR